MNAPLTAGRGVFLLLLQSETRTVLCFSHSQAAEIDGVQWEERGAYQDG